MALKHGENVSKLPFVTPCSYCACMIDRVLVIYIDFLKSKNVHVIGRGFSRC